MAEFCKIANSHAAAKLDWAAFTRTTAQTERARALRKAATGPERILWTKLARGQLGGFKFRRQHPVGRYVLDFYCPAVRLCIELDGFSHDEAAQITKDRIRDAFLRSNGIDVLRFSNQQVKENLIGVAETILGRAQDLSAMKAVEAEGIPSPWKGEG
ncbi:MAG: endonuclease domain-containing protein [Parvularculaceae bacterium]|nr:endonuclease domain-containing protein [Parvularculaceae bacterium]